MQEKFVQELIKGKSQREAYRLAYNADNMSDSTVDSNASRLFKNSKVSARYSKLRSKVVQQAEEKTIMSVMDVLKELESIAKDNIANYIEFGTEKTDEGMRPFVRLKDSKTIDTKNISEISIGANGTFKLKMYSRQDAINKMLEVYGENAVAKAKQRLAEERFEEDKRVNGMKYF